MNIKDKRIQLLLKQASVIAENSPDEETKVGSILVSKQTLSVLSEGYNGFVRGTNDSLLPKTRPDKHKYVIHAEQNLITNAARNGVRTDNCFVVQTHSPCVNCSRLLFQAGIDTIYAQTMYNGTSNMENLGDLTFHFTYFDTYLKMIIKPNK